MRTIFEARQRRIAFGAAAIICAASCAPDGASAPASPAPGAEDPVIFPQDRPLMRPEDGVALADGTLVVADQRHGLVAISPDGAVRPFGNFAAAGYVHQPPEQPAGPNGVALEPDGAHVLTADVFTGAIWRTDIASETTTLAFRHDYGVNTAVADSSGAIWFTQSTENNGPHSEERLFAAVDTPMTDGVLFRIAPPAEDGSRPAPERKVDGLAFANGFAIDEAGGKLYLNETMGDRVSVFTFSAETGALSDRRELASVLTPDNIEQDEAGRLWVASPVSNSIFIVDPASGAVATAFHPPSGASDNAVAEWRRRAGTGEKRLALMSPEMWAPLPGLVTGVILTPGGGPVYVSGLGDALVKLDAPAN